MAKYYMPMKCGHKEIHDVDFHGSLEKEQAYQATRLCRDCYYEQQKALRDEKAKPAKENHE